MKIKRRKSSGYSLTTIFMVIFFFAALWAGVQFFIAYFADTKIEQHLTETILKNRSEPQDGVLIEAIVADIKGRDELDIDPKSINILRSSDGQKISVKFPYSRRVKIPLTDKTWDISFEARAEETLSHRP